MGTDKNTTRLLDDRQHLTELRRHLEWYIAWHTTPQTDDAVRNLLRTVGRKLTYNDRAMKSQLGEQWRHRIMDMP